MTDYERGVEQASAIYKEVIREYVAENAKLLELVEDMHAALQAFCDAQDVHGDNCPLWVERTDDCGLRGIERRMHELGVDE